MYTILSLNCTAKEYEFFKQTLEQLGTNTQCLSCRSLKQGKELAAKHNVQCIIANLNHNFEKSVSFLQNWQKNNNYCKNIFILIANNSENLLFAMSHLHQCTIIAGSLDDEKKEDIRILLNHHYHLHMQFYAAQTAEPLHSIYLKTERGIKICYLNDILYIEAFKHKCYLHTRDDMFLLPKPLCQVKECEIFKDYLHYHRSFLINPANIEYVESAGSSYIVSFSNSNKHAYVSRNYKKDLEKTLIFKI